MLGLSIITLSCYANNKEIQPSSNELQGIIEASNVDVESYVWQIILTTNPHNREISVNLDNPNPYHPELDQRALDIARTITFQDLVKTIPNHVENQNKNYSLSIRFIHGVTIKTKPNLTQATAYIRHMCQTYLTNSDFRAGLISQEKNFVSGWIKLLVNQKGMITKIEFLNQTEDKKFNKLMENSFKSMNFYPFNKNGIPISYTAAQAFKITCDPNP